jgi:hypothetical protein
VDPKIAGNVILKNVPSVLLAENPRSVFIIRKAFDNALNSIKSKSHPD